MSTRAANSMGPTNADRVPTNKSPNADDSQTHHHNSGFDETDDDSGDVAKLPQSGFAADSITEPSAGPAPQQPRPPPDTAATTNSTGAHEVNGVIGNGGGGAGLFNGYFGGLFGGYAAGPNVPLNINGYTTKKSLAQGMLDLALLASNASQLSFVLTVGPAHPFYTLLLTLIATSMGLQVSIK